MVQLQVLLHFRITYDLAYTYGKTEGRKFQLAEVKDANYRTEENPDSVTKVDNSYIYTYDANGNLVYVNTGRIKQDGALDSTAAERKLRWDEENRCKRLRGSTYETCFSTCPGSSSLYFF